MIQTYCRLHKGILQYFGIIDMIDDVLMLIKSRDVYTSLLKGTMAYNFWFRTFCPWGWKSLTIIPSCLVFSINNSNCCSNASNLSALSAIFPISVEMRAVAFGIISLLGFIKKCSHQVKLILVFYCKKELLFKYCLI